MAHACIHCGSECYCNGDMDDVIVSKTPKSCAGCGCEEFAEDQGWGDDDWNDSDQEDDEGFEGDRVQKYSADGGIIDPDDPNIIHYPATK